ncbi:MAG TPA: SMC-Scp complex subunit ScpB [Steroidobacteraceae bacterium]|nr:SMC-Scp complex subunit ScpB [Steroidobacteraceae bacterium]
MNESYIRNVIEAALLAAGKPLQLGELAQLFDETSRPAAQELRGALEALSGEYTHRGIEVKETAAGFRIQVRREFANEISRLWPERPARYSRALLETLALIAYRQPITRAEIEAVRGVAVNPNIIKTVIERNWVRVVGHRDVPGRPEMLGTTREFLDYFGLCTLDELPPLAQLKAMGDINLQLDLPANAAADSAAPPVAAEADPEQGDAGPAAESVAAPAQETDRLQGAPDADEATASATLTGLEADDDSTDDDELSAEAPAASELVAGPRGMDD